LFRRGSPAYTSTLSCLVPLNDCFRSPYMSPSHRHVRLRHLSTSTIGADRGHLKPQINGYVGCGPPLRGRVWLRAHCTSLRLSQRRYLDSVVRPWRVRHHSRDAHANRTNASTYTYPAGASRHPSRGTYAADWSRHGEHRDASVSRAEAPGGGAQRTGMPATDARRECRQAFIANDA